MTIKGNVERSAPALVMSGAYTDGSNQPQTGYCNIIDKTTTLTGKISLTRLDSHITFKINPKMKTNGGKIISFEPKSWKVYNVPSKSYILTHGNYDDAVTDNKDDYKDTDASIRFDTENDKYNFDFYMLENRKKSKSYNGKTISKYEEREEEVKNDDKKNTGEYKYVEPYATFVELKAHMEIENGKDGIRVADATYVIHLGYVKNQADDFKNERNKKYTYNVTIEDVNSIITEVTDHTKEPQPGAEGDVVDSETQIYNIDAHYGYLILGFSYSQVASGLNFFVKTPFGETKQDSPQLNHDYKWLRFKANTNNVADKLEEYPKNGSGLIDLFGLENSIKQQFDNNKKKNNWNDAQVEAHKKDIYYYTVFIDEYYYEQHPCGTENWGNRAHWEEFANKENRYALLIFEPLKSADEESSYASAKYMITQKSIQTYYSTTGLNSDKIALGMEHVDETGVTSGWNSNYYGSSQKNGYQNTYYFWESAQISSYGDVTIPSNNTFKINNNVQSAIYDCMSRNRDENNDGYIKGEEIKWYLPATDQLVGMFLGAESLPTPLFGENDKEPGKTAGKTNGIYHYITSDKKRIWSEEGATFGAADVGYATAPKKLRCVRTLGVSSNTQSQTPSSDKNIGGTIYRYNSNTRTFYMDYFDAQSIRTSIVENRELDLHHNFSSYNRPYTAFQIAKDRMSTIGKGKFQATDWKSLVSNNGLNRSVCADYYENSESEKGTWRAPNQRELMIIYLQSPALVENRPTSEAWGDRYGSFTRTSWKFNENDHFTVDMAQITKGTVGSFVRCVRDVK
ncbi:DUF4906 domain-containing protein [Bacteroides sp. 1_1_14]|uniref:DUF4906 domain-containing protein n=1 Tax=Bacteroides sp. 1_1_14 TaxID=469585 RepID=UPI00240D83F6|nr:DUF4906 domain-containing protein [Bacteroides sp. 1_1_14]